MKKIMVLAMLSLAAQACLAEKADSLKQAVILYQKLDIDDVNQTQILTGDVSYTRGTLVMKAHKAVVSKTVDGNEFVTLTAAPGGLATFRQKRDGGPDLWIEGQAQRIEYDGDKELVKMSSKAKVKQLDSGKVAYETENEFIAYDGRKEVLVGRNDASGEDKPGKGRGMIILAPRVPKPAPANSTGKQ